MNCPTCGAENAPGTPACTRCGAPLAPQPPYTPPQGAYYPQQPVFGAPPNPPRSGSSGVLVALLGCGGCAVFLVPILAAILFPVFAKARDRAQQTQCMSSARQMAIAMQAYVNDNGNRLPPARSWETAIRPYVGGSANELKCSKATTGSGFVLNGSLAGRNTSIISDRSTTVLLFEGQEGSNVAGGPSLAIGRHGGRVTVAFADGSVRAVEQSELNRLRW